MMTATDFTHVHSPSPVATMSPEQIVLRQLLQHYAHNLSLRNSNLLSDYGIDVNMAADLSLGYCERGLQDLLPDDGAAEGVRGILQRLGVLLPSGHERFRNTLVIPDIDELGFCHQIAAYPLHQQGSVTGMEHVSLSEPRFFNEDVVAHTNAVIICARPLDGVMLRSAGLTSVIALAELRSFELRHLYTLEAHCVQKVCFAVGRHELGDAALVAQALESIGIQCTRMNTDKSVQASMRSDGRDYAVRACLEPLPFRASSTVSGWHDE